MDVEPGVAALLGALIGGLAGAVGQMVTEQLRQRGQRRHQNRLLLERTYMKLAQQLGEASRAAMDMAKVAEIVGKPQTSPSELETQGEILDILRSRFPDLLTELQDSLVAVRTVGSPTVADGIEHTLGWMSEVDTDPSTVVQSQTAAMKAIAWAEWTLKVIRSHLRVKDSLAVTMHRRGHPAPYPGSPAPGERRGKSH